MKWAAAKLFLVRGSAAEAAGATEDAANANGHRAWASWNSYVSVPSFCFWTLLLVMDRVLCYWQLSFTE